jgi:hypothetical protein
LSVALVGTPVFGSSLLCTPTSDTADCASMKMHTQSAATVTNQESGCCKITKHVPNQPPANTQAENSQLSTLLVDGSVRIDAPKAAPMHTTYLRSFAASPPDLQSLLCVLLI